MENPETRAGHIREGASVLHQALRSGMLEVANEIASHDTTIRDLPEEIAEKFDHPSYDVNDLIDYLEMLKPGSRHAIAKATQRSIYEQLGHEQPVYDLSA